MTGITELNNTELEEVLQGIKDQYGYDFTDYARASMHRRVYRFMCDAGLKNFYELKNSITGKKATFDFFLERITVNVTEMFRDPEFYKVLKDHIFPRLATYPLIRIWHAGCATGEEVFSIAILLHEAGLLNRARIYATDINPMNLEKAKKGILNLQLMKDYANNYKKAGGNADFTAYYTSLFSNALIAKELRENIVFSQHNLVTDHVFNEFQLICCRNVMIYFNKKLQNKVVNVMYESLALWGYLALGLKESLLFTNINNKFEVTNSPLKIFRKIL